MESNYTRLWTDFRIGLGVVALRESNLAPAPFISYVTAQAGTTVQSRTCDTQIQCFICVANTTQYNAGYVSIRCSSPDLRTLPPLSQVPE